MIMGCKMCSARTIWKTWPTSWEKSWIREHLRAWSAPLCNFLSSIRLSGSRKGRASQRTALPTHPGKMNFRYIQGMERYLWCRASWVQTRFFVENKKIFLLYHMILYWRKVIFWKQYGVKTTPSCFQKWKIYVCVKNGAFIYWTWIEKNSINFPIFKGFHDQHIPGRWTLSAYRA